MKNLIGALILMFCFGSTVAQELRFGVKAGLNSSSLTDKDDSAKNRTSFHLGAVLEIPLSESFSLQPELVYSQQGIDYEFDASENIIVNTEEYLNYLQIPILVKYYPLDRFALEAGPQVGFMVSDDPTDLYRTVDFSVGLGGSYTFDSGLFIQARYAFGLTNVYDDVSTSFSSLDPIIQNQLLESNHSVFQFSIGYLFNP